MSGTATYGQNLNNNHTLLPHSSEFGLGARHALTR
jgi:hypothetical protein